MSTFKTIEAQKLSADRFLSLNPNSADQEILEMKVYRAILETSQKKKEPGPGEKSCSCRVGAVRRCPQYPSFPTLWGKRVQ